jgi:hypothetical protein
MIMPPGSLTSFLAHMETLEILSFRYFRFTDASSDPNHGDDTLDQMSVVQAMLPQQKVSKSTIAWLDKILIRDEPTDMLGLLKALEPVMDSYHLPTIELEVSQNHNPDSTVPLVLAHVFRVWGVTWSRSPPSVTLRTTALLIAEKSYLNMEIEHHRTPERTSAFESIRYQVDHLNSFQQHGIVINMLEIHGPKVVEQFIPELEDFMSQHCPQVTRILFGRMPCETPLRAWAESRREAGHPIIDIYEDCWDESNILAREE